MKIIKLFHWLYGILMLLPILVFIPNAFYYGFNEQSIAQEKTEQVPVYYDTNNITTINDFIIDNVYSWNDNLSSVTLQSTYNFASVYVLNGVYANHTYTFFVNSSGIAFLSDGTAYNNMNSKMFDFKLISFKNGYENMPNEILEHFSICHSRYLKEYTDVTYTMSITDSMSYAWDSVWQNDLFSWSYESFLAEPFKYIGNVFGLPNDNSIYYCLSYWLDISIIWLCFDLIMYVPLLVHRWIDKGVLE